MDWQQVLFPVSVNFNLSGKQVGDVITINNGESFKLDNVSTVFIGVEQGGNQLSNTLREHLYTYRNTDGFEAFADLGDYTLPKEITQSNIDELGFIFSDLMEQDIHIVTYCNVVDLIPKVVDRAYDYLKQFYSTIETNVTIASDIDFGQLEAKNWLSNNLDSSKSLMHHYGILGYQSNHISQDQIEHLHKLGFESERLGNLKSSITKAEPYVRMGNFLQVDFRSIKSSYTGLAHQYPNGLNGEEACAILKYAGANSEMRAVNLFANGWGLQDLGAELMAQMIWYYIEGTQIGFEEDPLGGNDNYAKYHTNFEKSNESIIFYKSLRSGKWWIYLPVDHEKYPRYKYLIPCDYSDYQMATEGEIPYRWVLAVSRLDS
ncbi:MAG: hypothetical protein JXQ87_16500 [Bacteroidia bacterium]